MGAMVRIVGMWVAATALIVVGVDAAIERVARDVTIARPAPLAPSDVGELLRERDRAPATTMEVGPPSTGVARSSPSATATATSVAATAPAGSPGGPDGPDAPRPISPGESDGPDAPRPTSPGELDGPDGPRPTSPGGQPSDAGTTTSLSRDAPGRPDEREGPRGP